MGSESFTAFKKNTGDNDVSTAFRAAVEEAAYEHGHGGYTGTIAEKSGYTMRPSPGKLTVKEAYGFADTDDGNDKWGDAYAVEVYDDARENVIGWMFYGWASC